MLMSESFMLNGRYLGVTAKWQVVPDGTRYRTVFIAVLVVPTGSTYQEKENYRIHRTKLPHNKCNLHE